MSTGRFSDCYGKEQVDFWNELAKSSDGRQFIRKEFFGYFGSYCGRFFWKMQQMTKWVK